MTLPEKAGTNPTSDPMESVYRTSAACALVLVLMMLFLLFIVREVALFKKGLCWTKHPCKDFFQNVVTFHSWAKQINEAKKIKVSCFKV